ncbi:MAG: glycosyltransferase family 2 protein [Candidatus Bathyarchaeales archaeon]
MKKPNLQPLVSVIIPTYNSQNNIRQCIISIKRQTYKKIETLVVDRYSSDNTRKIAEELEAKVFLLDGKEVKRETTLRKKLKAVFFCSSIRIWCYALKWLRLAWNHVYIKAQML